MARIKLEMHINDALFAMSDGNPGAITVLMDSVTKNSEIDPMNALGPWGLVLNLDEFEIYGHRIWGLYKNLCGEDLPRTTAVVRATQLGIISRETLNQAIDGKTTIDIKEITDKVRDELPDFNFS
jgi:hypothetical protein